MTLPNLQGKEMVSRFTMNIYATIDNMTPATLVPMNTLAPGWLYVANHYTICTQTEKDWTDPNT